MEMLIGIIMSAYAVPIGLGFGLAQWAFGTRFPMALLQACFAIMASFIIGLYLVNDATSEVWNEHRSSHSSSEFQPSHNHQLP